MDIKQLREVEKEMPPAPLRTAECKTGANCWCRMVVGENGDEFIPAGFIRKTEAEFLVALRNAAPYLFAVVEAAEEIVRVANLDHAEPVEMARCRFDDLDAALANFRNAK